MWNFLKNYLYKPTLLDVSGKGFRPIKMEQLITWKQMTQEPRGIAITKIAVCSELL